MLMSLESFNTEPSIQDLGEGVLAAFPGQSNFRTICSVGSWLLLLSSLQLSLEEGRYEYGVSSAVQCSAVQCNTVECSAVKCSAVQFNAMQCNA